jgi:hypothetical protein
LTRMTGTENTDALGLMTLWASISAHWSSSSPFYT